VPLPSGGGGGGGVWKQTFHSLLMGEGKLAMASVASRKRCPGDRKSYISIWLGRRSLQNTTYDPGKEGFQVHGKLSMSLN